MPRGTSTKSSRTRHHNLFPVNKEMATMRIALVTMRVPDEVSAQAENGAGTGYHRCRDGEGSQPDVPPKANALEQQKRFGIPNISAQRMNQLRECCTMREAQI